MFVVELRHIFGMVRGDDGNPIGLEEEIKIFQRVFAHINNEYPLFRATIINSGLKIVGKTHIDFEIAATIRSKEFTDLVTGFDMVNEEDYVPPVIDFVREMMEAKVSEEAKG